MDAANSIEIHPGTKRLPKALRYLIVGMALAVMCGVAFGATPTVASLNGTYTFQFTVSKEGYWSSSKKCTYKGVTNTYGAGGQTAYTELNWGTVTFDGKGHMTLAMNDAHQINQAASNATAIVTCNSNGTVNTQGGHIVYAATTSGTATGTYTVSANGTGVMTLPGDDGSVDLELTLFNAAGLSTTVLMRSMDNNIGTGIAIHK